MLNEYGLRSSEQHHRITNLLSDDNEENNFDGNSKNFVKE